MASAEAPGRATDHERADRDRLALLGLAQRAGRAVVGTRAIRTAARSGSVRVLVVARDAAPNAVERVRGAAAGLRVVRLGTRQTLGRAVGRDSVALVGVTDTGFAGRLAAGLGHIEILEERPRKGRMRKVPGRQGR